MNYYLERHGKFRHGRKYRKNANHTKKQVEVDPWRLNKLRDHRRRKRYFYYRIPPCVKDFTNAKLRQWTRQQLAHERYDEMSVTGKWEIKSLLCLWSYT